MERTHFFHSPIVLVPATCRFTTTASFIIMLWFWDVKPKQLLLTVGSLLRVQWIAFSGSSGPTQACWATATKIPSHSCMQSHGIRKYPLVGFAAPDFSPGSVCTLTSVKCWLGVTKLNCSLLFKGPLNHSVLNSEWVGSLAPSLISSCGFSSFRTRFQKARGHYLSVECCTGTLVWQNNEFLISRGVNTPNEVKLVDACSRKKKREGRAVIWFHKKGMLAMDMHWQLLHGSHQVHDLVHI